MASLTSHFGIKYTIGLHHHMDLFIKQNEFKKNKLLQLKTKKAQMSTTWTTKVLSN